MNRILKKRLTQDARELNSARRKRDPNWIAECYEQIAITVGKIYQTADATIALELERVLIAGEQNGISKTSNTHKAISEHLKRLAKAQRADSAQRKNPRKYHSAAYEDHADRHFKNGAADDVVRVALAECRKRVKYLITAMGAEDNEPKRECNLLRHGGLLNAERNYIERQVEYQEEYDSREEKKQVQELCLKSFDAKIRREERELRMTPDSPFMPE